MYKTLCLIIDFFKMVYSILTFLVLVLSYLCNILRVLSSFSVFVIHYFGIFLFLICFLSIFLKLKRPRLDVVEAMLDKNSLFYPIAFMGSFFENPENSKVSIENCVTLNCKKVLLKLDMTKCKTLVILESTTLEKANIWKPINKVTYEELKEFNISEYHPLG